ncbi:MAG: hypothetical protein RL698_3399 [Pseudomonadota bacterium]|jgi:hypothetical protein
MARELLCSKVRMTPFNARRVSLLWLPIAMTVLAVVAAVTVAGLVIGRSQPPPGATYVADLDESGLPVVAKNGQSILFERITVCYPTESIHPRWDAALRFPHRDQSLITAVDDATAGGACMSVRMLIVGWPMRVGAWWTACGASGEELRSGFTLLSLGAVGNVVVTSAVSVFAVTLWLWLRKEIQVRRVRDMRCWRCGYPLVAPMAEARAASDSRAAIDHNAACPECGAFGAEGRTE